jgi:DhnA family fructose-bisphosphate aldolase class Ia
MQRLFAADGRCLDVAVDHGFFGEPRFLAGIADLEAALAVLVEAAPDAIQLAPGQAPLLQRLPRPKPALVLRTDVANVYGEELPRHVFSEVVAGAVPDRPELLHQCIRNVAALRAACDPVGMPLMVEPLAMKPGAGGSGVRAGEAGTAARSASQAPPYGVDGDVEKIVPLVRQAVELGADVIKADPTDDVQDYRRVLEVAGGRPVLVRGGGRAPDEEILARTEAVMRIGAAGIVYGRNIIQHAHPSGMTRALMAIVHDGATAADAAAHLRG